ncbi:MAG: hypothetical protein JRM78_01465 [Nitrososphaerota archaeon]|nr:hypothetical protein [Nitrososphaerota archaeon]MDG7036889.1 hypothetical protein [Nitrososphaerota archaeon]MDG7040484.1 hypothetical protein [Nitrososphaerota archaeon]
MRRFLNSNMRSGELVEERAGGERVGELGKWSAGGPCPVVWDEAAVFPFPR